MSDSGDTQDDLLPTLFGGARKFPRDLSAFTPARLQAVSVRDRPDLFRLDLQLEKRGDLLDSRDLVGHDMLVLLDEGAGKIAPHLVIPPREVEPPGIENLMQPPGFILHQGGCYVSQIPIDIHDAPLTAHHICNGGLVRVMNLDHRICVFR